MAEFLSRPDIVASARECIGTPWVHLGRTVGQRLDCVGVVLHVLRKHGMSNFEPPAYQRRAQWGEFLPYFQQELAEVPRAEMLPGDVICFRQEKYPCHCGILTYPRSERLPPRFVHGYALRRQVVEQEYSQEWRSLTRAVFRFPGV